MNQKPDLTARQALDLQLSEDDVDATLREAVKRSTYPWATYHPYSSKRSTAGFADWTLVCPPWIAIWELKSETGAIRPEQRQWLSYWITVRQFYPQLSVAIIRPSNMPVATNFLINLTKPPQTPAGAIQGIDLVPTHQPRRSR